MSTTEQFIKVNDAELCVQSYGDPAEPAILLLHGAGHSLLNWDDEFIGQLVAVGRYVIRYDSRDAGRSTSYPVGAPTYGLSDLAADAAGVLEALGIPAAHVVGMSQGAGVAQLLALDHADRVLSVTLASATPGGPGHWNTDLPAPSDEIQELFANEPPQPNWTDRAAVIDYLVEAERPYSARFDDNGMRELAGRIVDRTVNIAAQLNNPFLISAGDPWRERLAGLRVPALVFHGTDDPMFPIGHGRALAAEITGADFLPLEQTGHEVFPRHTWETVVPAILKHTEPA
ncbi:hypothetical protein GCM10029976_013340 [Kribbella albertanoniae]|uniref:Alpha/beta hydrolase n=1 Tax=Kribbella albertanoniae TaxID=1266829 RepID=A0A4R4Q2U6_9ACTN|nr:alpha/beta hydrolase [Kribbella albertanoniae]TDC29162.1 alpha/beta hydrolase [Kribbella albertanoniae]